MGTPRLPQQDSYVARPAMYEAALIIAALIVAYLVVRLHAHRHV
jgi:hypothetical protein